jgi:hypothetical protein
VAKKIVAKKITPKDKFEEDFKEVQALLKDLRLDLKKVTEKVEGLCHTPLRASPNPPPPPKK